jgi:hypothetical protein
MRGGKNIHCTCWFSLRFFTQCLSINTKRAVMFFPLRVHRPQSGVSDPQYGLLWDNMGIYGTQSPHLAEHHLIHRKIGVGVILFLDAEPSRFQRLPKPRSTYNRLILFKI